MMKHNSKMDAASRIIVDSEINAEDIVAESKKGDKLRAIDSISKKGSTLSLRPENEEAAKEQPTLTLKKEINSRADRHQSNLSVGKQKDSTEVYRKKQKLSNISVGKK